ncbi:hypothetical protein AAHI06_02075 [Pseudomonas salmasensis]
MLQTNAIGVGTEEAFAEDIARGGAGAAALAQLAAAHGDNECALRDRQPHRVAVVASGEGDD